MRAQDSILHRQIDEYQIVKLLGRGGMARVYQAVDIRLKRNVAIKVIDKSHRSKSDYIKRFKQEAQAIARLEHPHIVRLYRYGELDDLVYMAMQYIEGMDLAVLLQSYRADGEYLELEEITRLIGEICQGLDYAHEQGVIHRDVKPSNIMIDREGRAILTDFGLAMLAEVTTQGHVLGSPHYLSPEQAVSSANVVPQSDLYSVGVILYEMLTGEVPFTADEPLDVAKMHISEPVPLPSKFRPEISRDLERMLLKCLDKNPANRYQTGDELVRALKKAAEGLGSDTSKSIPARISIPERVNMQGANLSFPPIPAAVAQPSPPLKESPSPVTAETSQLNRPPLFPVMLGTGAFILVLFLCVSLVAGSLWVANRIGGNENPPSTSLAQVSPSPTSTLIPSPSATPVLVKSTITQTPIANSAPLSTSFKLMIATRRDDSMIIINTGETAFFLPPLNLQEGDIKIVGNAWDVEVLQPGQCVVAMKDSGNPKLPDVECEEVGERLYLPRGDRIWDQDFDVYYGSTEIDTCDEEDDKCEVEYGYDDD